MLAELHGDKEAQVTLMALLAEKNEFDKTKTVKEFMVVTGFTNQTKAYYLYKKAKELADIRKEIGPISVRFLFQMDRAMTKAVTEYEKTGKGAKDIVEIGNLMKEVLGLQSRIDNTANRVGGLTVIQNNADPRSLEAVAKELAKDTINVKPEGFGEFNSGTLPE